MKSPKDYRNYFIAKYLLQRGLVPGLLFGASARLAAELFKEIALQRAKSKREKQIKKIYETHEIDVPYLKISSSKAPPDERFLPSSVPFAKGTLLGLSAYLGWSYLSRLFDKYRQRRIDSELQNLKKQLDNELLRHDVINYLSTGEPPPSYKKLKKESSFYALAFPSMLFLASFLGAATYPWKSERKEKIKAYNAYMNEKLLNRSLPLSIKPKPVVIELEKDEDKDENEKQASMLAKRVLSKAPQVLKYLSWRIPVSVASALGGSYLMTNTRLGRAWLKARFKDLMKDPNYVRDQIHSIVHNPNLWGVLREELLKSLNTRNATV